MRPVPTPTAPTPDSMTRSDGRILAVSTRAGNEADLYECDIAECGRRGYECGGGCDDAEGHRWRGGGGRLISRKRRRIGAGG